MKVRIEEGALTGLPIVYTVPDDEETSAFREQLLKEGVVDMTVETAEACLSIIGERMSPEDAAWLIGTVIRAVGVSPEQYFGAAMATRSLWDISRSRP